MYKPDCASPTSKIRQKENGPGNPLLHTALVTTKTKIKTVNLTIGNSGSIAYESQPAVHSQVKVKLEVKDSFQEFERLKGASPDVVG
jgi:hypothetical protein